MADRFNARMRTCACHSGGDCDLVDAQTMICRRHDVQACVICMCDEMEHATGHRIARRAQLKREWRETPIAERYDLGGES